MPRLILSRDMQLDFKTREVTVKLVYYGPALSGKTTNLQAIHRLVSDDAAGRLMTLETRDDRTLFFDLLPLTFEGGGGIQVRFKLFTVPGQVIHDATRRLVLQGADGTAFIADSQVGETKANQQAFRNMQRNLKENGVDPKTHPLVLQFNKRDLPGIRTDEEIDAMASQGQRACVQSRRPAGRWCDGDFPGFDGAYLATPRIDAQAPRQVRSRPG